MKLTKEQVAQAKALLGLGNAVTALPPDPHDASAPLEERVACLERWAARVTVGSVTPHMERRGPKESPFAQAARGEKVVRGNADVNDRPNFSQRIIEIERALAYSAARSDIEFNCARVNAPLEKPAEWARDELAIDNVHPDDRESMMAAVARAVEYLDYRGLLVHALGRQHTMTIKDAP